MEVAVIYKLLIDIFIIYDDLGRKQSNLTSQQTNTQIVTQIYTWNALIDTEWLLLLPVIILSVLFCIALYCPKLVLNIASSLTFLIQI